MNAQLVIEEKHSVLMDKLTNNLKKKRVLELEITEQFEQLKKIEVLMEKASDDDSQGEKTVARLKGDRSEDGTWRS